MQALCVTGGCSRLLIVRTDGEFEPVCEGVPIRPLRRASESLNMASQAVYPRRARDFLRYGTRWTDMEGRRTPRTLGWLCMELCRDHWLTAT